MWSSGRYKGNDALLIEQRRGCIVHDIKELWSIWEDGLYNLVDGQKEM